MCSTRKEYQPILLFTFDLSAVAKVCPSVIAYAVSFLVDFSRLATLSTDSQTCQVTVPGRPHSAPLLENGGAQFNAPSPPEKFTLKNLVFVFSRLLRPQKNQDDSLGPRTEELAQL